MRVGIDATSWRNRRGFGRFLRNVVGRLVALERDVTYVLYVDEVTAAHGGLPAGAEQRRVSVAGSVTGTGGRSPSDLIRLTRGVRRGEVDVFVFPSLHGYFPVIGVPIVLGLHDAIADELPRLALGGARARLLWQAKQRLALRQAGSLFTVSAASRLILAERLKLPPERLTLVPEAPDPVFHPRSEAEIARVLGSLGLDRDRPLFVYAAGISPHKNVEGLIDAYAGLRRRLAVDPQLVIAGELQYASYLSSASDVLARIRDLGLGDSVLTPGFVSDDALACLYSAATAAVVPSLAEGFGLPAVEAAACAAAVVLSDLPAHRENLGADALYFPATDVAALTAQLERVADDSELRRGLGDRARRAVGALSWDVSARCLAGVIAGARRGHELRA